MGEGFGKFFVFFSSIVTLAMVAVLVSQKAQTASVISALGSATGSAIRAATAPVTPSK